MNKLLLGVLISVVMIQFSIAQDYRFGKVSKEELMENKHPLENDANAAILYRRMRTSFNYSQDNGFVARTEVHERIKIYNRDGYNWGTISIPYSNSGRLKESVEGLKAFTYNLEGKKVEKEKLKNKDIFDKEINKYREEKTFTMPALKEGSVIEVSYILNTPFIGKMGKYTLQENIPIKKVDFQFNSLEWHSYKPYIYGWTKYDIAQERVPRTLKYTYTSTNRAGTSGRLPSSVTNRSNEAIELSENVYRLDVDNVASLGSEPLAPNISAYRFGIEFELAQVNLPNSPIKRYSKNWESVAESIYFSSDFGSQLEKSRFFEKDIDNLISNISNPLEKTIRIFEYVKNRMNWNGVYGAYAENGVSKAYDDQSGNVADINLMLVSMLKYANIDSAPILLSTKSNGVPLFPTLSGFDFVIAAANIGGNTILLDGTDKMGVPNQLRPELINWYGRLVQEDGTSETIGLDPEKAIHQVIINASINPEIDVVAQVKSRYSGHWANKFRYQLTNRTLEDQNKALSDHHSIDNLKNLEFSELSDIYKPLGINYDVILEDDIEDMESKLYVTPGLFLTMDHNFLKADTRLLPIDFEFPQEENYIIKIKIPDGYKVNSLPESISLNTAEGIGSYKYQVSENFGNLQIAITRTINKFLVSSSYYGDLKSFYDIIIEKEAEKIVLSKVQD
ncbi:DUF3857 domain-containing protein [Dokdonia sinensis]|uniref:DUF3857 domain-containing protein n=1 Tax=Dokdonia sinensis TaxID=2479847 RepID=A0A3M0GH15_9FLAO|nr:DUF3857 domain-containing protein [Dokdonia sinensis]RMB56616.1 DUF3857 domain-containing protein [Dokdonia sinensis]